MTPNKEQYDELVAKYGKVSVIEIDGGYVATFHYNLDRNSLSKALSLSSNDPVLATEIIFNAVAIKEFTSAELYDTKNPMLLMSIANDLGAVMTLKKTNVKTY
jgi:hypothetical protein